VETGILTLSQLIEKMSLAPAQSLGVVGGSIGVGDVADITIFDPKAKWTVDADDFKSKSRNTIFNGIELTGKSIATIVDGKLVE
jgi:dihydroorotase